MEKTNRPAELSAKARQHIEEARKLLVELIREGTKPDKSDQDVLFTCLSLSSHAGKLDDLWTLLTRIT